uniref:Enoyl reductase (ER) domain-containing protein n=1 Tax=Aegilops tauschii subsp. strangulata TaxID=200361 RepID=A0A453S9L8_AEGTS
NRYIAVRHHVEGSPSVDDFEVKTEAVRWTPESGEVLVRNMYVSIDPYQLNRMKRQSASHHSVDVIVPGEVIFVVHRRPTDGEPAVIINAAAFCGCVCVQRIASYGAGEVVASACEEYKEGDVVAGMLAWEEYSVFRPASVLLMSKVDTSSGFPLSYQLGVLGTSGMTAYGGFYEVCKPQAGEKVFVSAASGSVGSLVGQFAKLAGCHVVGCAGTQAKVDMLKDKLGFDDAFNYKDEPDLKAALKRRFPDGIDIYFENVGGEMLEAALANMNTYGRVAVCGVIAEYTDPGRRAVPDLLEVIYKRITLRGFFAWDFIARFHEFTAIIGGWIEEGKVQVVEDVSDGLESVPSAFVALYRGENVGKKLVKLA